MASQGPFKLPGCLPGFPTPSPPGPPRRQTAPELQISLELLTEAACVCVEGPGADFASHRPHSTPAQAAFEGFPGQEAERVPLTVKDALGEDRCLHSRVSAA